MSIPTIYLSTSQVADLFNLEKPTIHARLNAHGHVNGITPRRLANGRYSWPREEVLAAAGLSKFDTDPVDLADSLDFIHARGLPTDDLLVVAVAKALSGTYVNSSYQVQAADDTQTIFKWVRAHGQRIKASLLHLEEGERAQATHYLLRIEAESQAIRRTLASGQEG